MEEQAKHPEKRNDTTWVPGKCGNPHGRPKKYKNQNEFKNALLALYEGYISGKLKNDLDKMTPKQRFDSWETMRRTFINDLTTTPDGSAPEGGLEIKVVFGKPKTKTEDTNEFEVMNGD